MALQADNIADLIIATQKELGRMKWTEITTDLQEHIAMPKLLRQEKVEFDSGGYGFQWNVMVTTAGSARNVGLYATDNVNVGDGMVTATAPWRHTTTSYAVDERELSMNRGAAKVYDLVKSRRQMAMIDLAALMETDFFGKPTDSTDTVKPFGLYYWVVKNGSAGFNGGNASGFTSGPGSLSASTYPRWSNYTAPYSAITHDDLVRAWRKASTFTNFMSPTGEQQPDYNTGNRYGYYTNYAVLGKLEEILESQNDNLGNDVASKDGMVLFRRTPVTWAPKLEADSTNPVYGINWGVFKPVLLEGWYLKEDAPIRAPNQHTVRQVHVDLSYNYKCTDRRRLFVISNGTTLP
jgi:hypothetical protein